MQRPGAGVESPRVSHPEYDPSPAHRLLRLLMRSFRIGVFFGVEVRMYWTAAILMPLLFWSWFAPVAETWGEELTLATIATVLLFVIIWSHEMGHIACGWRYRIRTDLITLSPLGGVAHMNAPATTPHAELGIALAGPAVHLVWLAVFWPLKLWLPYGLCGIEGWWDPIHFTVWFLVTTNVGLLLFNLLPIFPLDGGRSLRALLSMRWHPNRATMWATTIGFVGGGLLILSGLFRRSYESFIPICIGISCISACVNERRVARHALIYDESLRRELWEGDPDAWKRASASISHDLTRRRPGFFVRWRMQRAARRAAAAREADAALNREVDEILERVHKVGMTGLSNREKAVLKQAANRRRGAG